MDYRSIELDYKDLKLRIVKYYDNQRNFAKAIGMDYTALSARLNNKVEWKTWEIIKACDLLQIPLVDVHLFFYVKKVEKTETLEGL